MDIRPPTKSQGKTSPQSLQISQTSARAAKTAISPTPGSSQAEILTKSSTDPTKNANVSKKSISTTKPEGTKEIPAVPISPAPAPLAPPPLSPSPSSKSSSSDDVSTREAVRRWWSASGRKQKAAIFGMVVLFVVLIVVLGSVLIAFGTYIAIIEQQPVERIRYDPRLTTKTELCRATYPKIDPRCIYESDLDYEECGADQHVFCVEVRWEVSKTSDNEVVIKRRDVERPLNKTEYADCGYLKWCRDGKCVDSKVDPDYWFPPPLVVSLPPFDFKQPVSLAVLNTSLPCLHMMLPQESKETSERKFKEYFGDYLKCNSKGCSRSVEYGFRIGFHPCDTSIDWDGVRHMCGESHEPMKIIKCKSCRQFNETDGQTDPCRAKKGQLLSLEHCKYECRNSNGATERFLLEPGSWCDADRSGDGVCLLGQCYSALLDQNVIDGKNE